MATLAQRMGIPHVGWPGGTPSFTNFTVSDSTSGIGFQIQAKNANAITHIGYRYGARTGTPPVYVATLEGVSASTGFPDGTDVGGGSPTAVTFTPPADTSIDGLWRWVALTTPYTPTRGQLFAATIRYSSGTINGSNCSSFTTLVSNLHAPGKHSFPVSLSLTTGTWAKGSSIAVGGLRTASDRYGNIMESLYNTRSASTVGHRRAVKFIVPTGTCTGFTLPSFRLSGSIASATGKNPIVGLWNGAGTALQNITTDSDIVLNASTAYQNYDYSFDETTLSTLVPNTAYYLGLEVADGTSGGVLLNGIGVNASDDLDSMPGGTTWCLSSWDGASWTDTTTVRPFADMMILDLTGGNGGIAKLAGFGGGLVG